MVLRKYRYIAIKIKNEDFCATDFVHTIKDIIKCTKGEKMSYKLVNMTLIDFLANSKIVIVRVDRSASPEFLDCLDEEPLNKMFKTICVSGILKKIMKKLETCLKKEVEDKKSETLI